MELWRELLINGLQNDDKINSINDKVLKEILENEIYQVLLKVKKTIDDETLADKDCFDKLEEILNVLEENNISCIRHDFG